MQKTYLKTTQSIFCYFKGTANVGLFYKKKTNLNSSAHGCWLGRWCRHKKIIGRIHFFIKRNSSYLEQQKIKFYACHPHNLNIGLSWKLQEKGNGSWTYWWNSKCWMHLLYLSTVTMKVTSRSPRIQYSIQEPNILPFTSNMCSSLQQSKESKWFMSCLQNSLATS